MLQLVSQSPKLTNIQEHEEIIAICGTFFIMADSREVLGIQENRDDICLMEAFPRIDK